jgi:hypothetical protein
MVGHKLNALHQHLLDSGKIPSEVLSSYMERAKLAPVSKKLGNGLLIARVEYSAVFNLERCTVDPATLCSLVATWLLEYDSDRDRKGLSDPTLDVDAETQTLADVEFSVEFLEDIELVPDVEGSVLYKGQRYAVQTVPIDEITQIAVGNDQTQPVDLPVIAA